MYIVWCMPMLWYGLLLMGTVAAAEKEQNEYQPAGMERQEGKKRQS